MANRTLQTRANTQALPCSRFVFFLNTFHTHLLLQGSFNINVADGQIVVRLRWGSGSSYGGSCELLYVGLATTSAAVASKLGISSDNASNDLCVVEHAEEGDKPDRNEVNKVRDERAQQEKGKKEKVSTGKGRRYKRELWQEKGKKEWQEKGKKEGKGNKIEGEGRRRETKRKKYIASRFLGTNFLHFVSPHSFSNVIYFLLGSLEGVL